MNYNALSYVWGDSSSSVTITCDGHPFEITRNLYEVLSQLKKKGNHELLWVDAICINQSDDDEKTAQVRLMRTIYSGAALVIIWLGPELANDRVGFDLLSKLHGVLGKPEYDDSFGSEYLDLEALGLPALRDEAWGLAVKILSRPWFSRIWVIQEYVVARHSVFLCGDIEMEPHLLLEAAGNISRYPSLRNAFGLHDSTSSLGSYVNAVALYGLCSTLEIYGNRRLLELLWTTCRYEFTKPCDRIFAILALTDDISYDFINYRKDHHQVLIDLAVFMLETPELLPNNIDLLSFVGLRGQKSDLPSWVPDWTSYSQEFCPVCNIIKSDPRPQTVCIYSEINEVINLLIGSLSRVPYPC